MFTSNERDLQFVKIRQVVMFAMQRLNLEREAVSLEAIDDFRNVLYRLLFAFALCRVAVPRCQWAINPNPGTIVEKAIEDKTAERTPILGGVQKATQLEIPSKGNGTVALDFLADVA
jgi:hypothetical protein